MRSVTWVATTLVAVAKEEETSETDEIDLRNAELFISAHADEYNEWAGIGSDERIAPNGERLFTPAEEADALVQRGIKDTFFPPGEVPF